MISPASGTVRPALAGQQGQDQVDMAGPDTVHRIERIAVRKAGGHFASQRQRNDRAKDQMLHPQRVYEDEAIVRDAVFDHPREDSSGGLRVRYRMG